MALTHLLLEVLPQWLDPPLLILPLGVLIAHYELNSLCYIYAVFCTEKLEDILQWEK